MAATVVVFAASVGAGVAYARTVDSDGDDLVRGGGTHGEPKDHARDVLICGPGQDVLKGCEIKRPSN